MNSAAKFDVDISRLAGELYSAFDLRPLSLFSAQNWNVKATVVLLIVTYSIGFVSAIVIRQRLLRRLLNLVGVLVI